MPRVKKVVKESKYSPKIIDFLEVVEVHDDLDLSLWVYDGTPKWKIAKTDKKGNSTIRVTYEGEKLEELLKTVL